MTFVTPRWQLALLYTMLIGAGIFITLALIPFTSSFYQITAAGASCLSWGVAGVWIVVGMRRIHLRRERRAWTLLAAGIVLAGLGQSVVLAVPGENTPIWYMPALGCSYLAIWGALLTRSGKPAAQHFSSLLLTWDLVIVIWASAIIAFRLALPTTANSIGMPLLTLVTLCIIAVMLSRAVPLPLHGPRALLVLGILLVLVNELFTAKILFQITPLFSHTFIALGGIGFLCCGVAALWEEATYAERATRSRTIETLPSLLSQFIPSFVALFTIGVLLWSPFRNPVIQLGAFTLPSSTGLMASLIMLIIIRQLISVVGYQRLYGELQDKYVEMAQNASTDPLTHLANYRLFMGRLQKEMRRAIRYQRPLALIFCDLDHFKQINDTFGHITGDHALVALAECLRQKVREIDLIARYAGEEFVVLLPETQLAQAAVIADRLRMDIEEMQLSQRLGSTLRLTMSCGVSAYPDTCNSAETLLSSADRAMYEAKHNGRNRIVVAAPQAVTPVS